MCTICRRKIWCVNEKPKEDLDKWKRHRIGYRKRRERRAGFRELNGSWGLHRQACSEVEATQVVKERLDASFSSPPPGKTQGGDTCSSMTETVSPNNTEPVRERWGPWGDPGRQDPLH